VLPYLRAVENAIVFKGALQEVHVYLLTYFTGKLTSQATAGCWLAVTYFNAIIVAENHLRSVIGRHTACKR